MATLEPPVPVCRQGLTLAELVVKLLKPSEVHVEPDLHAKGRLQ